MEMNWWSKPEVPRRQQDLTYWHAEGLEELSKDARDEKLRKYLIK